jgi:hypothetical protein
VSSGNEKSPAFVVTWVYAAPRVRRTQYRLSKSAQALPAVSFTAVPARRTIEANADSFATMALLKERTEFSVNMLLQAVRGC